MMTRCYCPKHFFVTSNTFYFLTILFACFVFFSEQCSLVPVLFDCLCLRWKSIVTTVVVHVHLSPENVDVLFKKDYGEKETAYVLLFPLYFGT